MIDIGTARMARFIDVGRKTVTLLMLCTAAGCVVRAPAVSARSGDVVHRDGAITVLFSRDASPETSPALARKVVACVARAVQEAFPDRRVMSQHDFHRAIFPDLVPLQVRLAPDTMERLMQTRHVAERLRRLGVKHLILVGGGEISRGGSSSESSGLPDPRLGAASWAHTTYLTALIYEVGVEGVVTVAAKADGGGVAGGIMFVPFARITTTEASAVGRPSSSLP